MDSTALEATRTALLLQLETVIQTSCSPIRTCQTPAISRKYRGQHGAGHHQGKRKKERETERKAPSGRRFSTQDDFNTKRTRAKLMGARRQPNILGNICEETPWYPAQKT